MFNVQGYVQAYDLSGKHVRFTDVHRTYSPSPLIYNAGTGYATDFELVVLQQLKLNAIDTGSIDSALLTQTYDIIQWLFDQSVDGQLTTDTIASNAAIDIAFPAAEITINLGTLTSDTGNRILPEWVEIQIGDNLFKFWLLDTALENQYNIRQFRFADPITNKDSFYTSNKSGLQALMAAYVANPYGALTSTLAESPTTKIVPHVETWNEQSNPTNTIDVQFIVAVYGPRDPTSEELREAVRDYLLADSAHESGEWETVFPGIFSVSSFAVIPAWNNIVDGSIPQYYNPIVDISDYLPVLADAKFGYTAGWVEANLEALPTVYQSLLCLVIPDESNDLAKRKFAGFFNDYILAVKTVGVPTDYYRMNDTTKRLVDMLTAVLPIAEGITTEVPVGVTEEFANGLRWWRFTVGESQIRILSKASFESIVV